jgi:ribulose-bisphosphate carboxylase large chain
MSAERITATYLIETPLDVARAAEVLAGEQSSGTFVDVPGETTELRERFRARVERITELANAPRPSLLGSSSPAAATGGECRRAEQSGDASRRCRHSRRNRGKNSHHRGSQRQALG